MRNEIIFFWEDLPYKVGVSKNIAYDPETDALSLYTNGNWNQLLIAADGSVSASVVVD
jgi:hypothetical protein